MFGPKGNPSAQNLFGVIAALQKAEGVSGRTADARTVSTAPAVMNLPRPMSTELKQAITSLPN